jgi:DNA polymerase-3 subunit gamma/tau
MLLKGITEVKDAQRPLPAAEMVLVRLAHAADLPTPDEALKLLQSGQATPARQGGAAASPAPAPARPSALAPAQSGPSSGGPRTAAAPSPVAAATPRMAMAAEPAPRLASLEDIVALASRHRDIKLQAQLQRDVRPVRIEPGRIEIALSPTGDRAIANDLSRKLKDWTGQTWMVAVVQAEGAATLREQRDAAERSRRDSAAQNGTVKALMAAFPGARIVDVRRRSEQAQGDADETGAVDAGLAASLESGEGLYDSADDSYSDIDF